MTAMEKIGHNIRRVRRAADISQEAAAERAGIHRTMISLYEWGEREPLSLSLVKLAAALGVELTVLLEGVSWEPARQRFAVEEDA